MSDRNVTEERFSLYRLCACPVCEGRSRLPGAEIARCLECRGEGRVRQEIATAETPEAVGVAIVTLGREHEWEGCAFGLLDRRPECPVCEGSGKVGPYKRSFEKEWTCHVCEGSGVKPTGDWLVLPWMPSPRNVRDAARVLARSKKSRPSTMI